MNFYLTVKYFNVTRRTFFLQCFLVLCRFVVQRNKERKKEIDQSIDSIDRFNQSINQSINP